jgi:uncharacterized protein
MKLHEHRQPQLNLVGRYDHGVVVIEGRQFTRPCVVAPGLLHHDWISSPGELSISALEILWPLQPRILLLGTVAQPAGLRTLRQQLAARGVSLECMDMGAACRTYNVLAQEDRAVAALLFPGDLTHAGQP